MYIISHILSTFNKNNCEYVCESVCAANFAVQFFKF